MNRTFVLFDHDRKIVSIFAPKASLQKALDEAIAKTKRFVTTASSAARER